MNWLWPIHTGKTFFDVWSIAHLAYWLFVGSVLWSCRADRSFAFSTCLVLASTWELFERFAERRWPGTWMNPESPLNTFSDVVMVAVGVLGIWYALDHWRAP